jgi:hypothetical protein
MPMGGGADFAGNFDLIKAKCNRPRGFAQKSAFGSTHSDRRRGASCDKETNDMRQRAPRLYRSCLMDTR